MQATEQNVYDTVVYPGLPFVNTHPMNLAAKAILHGLSPAPVERCRVLEVGCNRGGNLIPMAYEIPTSEFVGFDLAAVPIERGRQRIEELKLANVRLFQADLLDVGPELGQFDYIIAHGVYAWVPAHVRDGLLALCRKLLTPDGVAFISYNALPGSHARGIIRDALLPFMKGTGDPEEEIESGLKLIRTLMVSMREQDPFRLWIEEHLAKMEGRRPGVTFHDELAAGYDPVRFADFVEHAGRHGLQYLSEAELPLPFDPGYKAELRAALEAVAAGDLVKQEQMLDLARARKYRETLLCRAERTVRRDYPVEHFRRLRFATEAKSEPADAPGQVAFVMPGGVRTEMQHPGLIAFLREIEKARPRALSFDELAPTLKSGGIELDANASVLLMRLAISKVIELTAWCAPVAEEISERPRASAYARLEARTEGHATTLLHTLVKIEDPVAVHFLTLLDGTRDRIELSAALQAAFPDRSAESIDEHIQSSLENIFLAGLLEA